MNPSLPSSRQQDPSITILCHILIKAVYLFVVLFFFQSVQLLPVICWGPSFPPTLKLGHSASDAKTPSFFSSSPPPSTAFSPAHNTHTFPAQALPGSVRAGHGQWCMLWAGVGLETKTGQSPEAQTTGAGPLLGRHGLCVTRQQKHSQTKALKPRPGDVMNPAAHRSGEVFTLSPLGKSLVYLHSTAEIPQILEDLRSCPF